MRVRIGFCATEEPLADVDLWAAEAELVAGATTARRREFATGRACAREALSQLDLGDHGPLTADGRGAPLWPAGVVGSITHTTGWTGAVAARRGWGRGLSGLGLDAEPVAPLPAGVLEVVASPGERQDLRRLGAADPTPTWPVVLFTAKEAAYKAVYPSTGEVLAHDDVAVDLRADGRFTATARRRRVRGRWVQGHRVVVSLAVVG